MKKWYLLFLIICSCGAYNPEDWFNSARYDYPNSIKEQILNADCIELKDIRTELRMSRKMISKLKKSRKMSSKSYRRANDSLNILIASTYSGRYKLRCSKEQRNVKKRIN